MRALLTATCLFAVPVHAVSHCDARLGIAAITADLRRDVESLEDVADPLRDEAERLESARRAAKDALQALERNAGWREKHLPAWLGGAVGGDAHQRRELVERRRIAGTAQTELAAAHQRLDQANRAVVEAIERFLEHHVVAFAALIRQERATRDALAAGKTTLDAIDEAISRVSSARSNDMVAGVFDNKAAQIFAAFSESSANTAVAEVKNIVPVYARKLETVRQNARRLDADHLQGVNINLQMAIDFGTGSSFMDWANAFALGQTKSQLEELKTHIETSQASLKAAHDELLPPINELICAVREDCRNGRAAAPSPWGQP